MGEFADDAYEYAMQEMFQINEHIDYLVESTSAEKVIECITQSFEEEPVDEDDQSERLAQDILKTINRTNKVSEKQKRCLVRVLFYRGTEGYEM